ncbi:hypothetical protein F5I97DRAFT_979549 [Phlebopus sp. FC_14]|nr:hypothetical protein F5I97DRAFT_979549 [Phlebopus sp. FC_14]
MSTRSLYQHCYSLYNPQYILPQSATHTHAVATDADPLALPSSPHLPPSCPVNRMPPEILGTIFEKCLPLIESSSTSSCFVFPSLSLGRVCRYWRDILYSTPRLWTSLSFHFLEANTDRRGDKAMVSSALSIWLRRSSSLPLSLSFKDPRIFQKDTEELVIWLLCQIKEHAQRLRSIHLQFSPEYFIQLSILSLCKFTSLESFSVHVDHLVWRSASASVTFDLTSARRLKTLSYTGPDQRIREQLLVDWDRLTKIAFQYDLHEGAGETSTLARHFNALALCQNLTVLSIGIGEPFNRHTDDFIVLPHLHTLQIRRLSRRSHARVIVDAFVLPQLEILDIDSAILTCWDDWGTRAVYWHDSQFSEMLARSGCKLKELYVKDVAFPDAELMHCLASAAPTLTHFSFLPYPRSQPIKFLIDHLHTAPHTPRCQFLKLQNLELGCAHTKHFEQLADMVESRTGAQAVGTGVTPLADFRLVFYDFFHEHRRRRGNEVGDLERRLRRCAENDGQMNVSMRVERLYDTVYLPL